MLSNNPTLNIPSPQAGVTARYLQLLAAAERLPDPATDTTGLQRALLDALDVGLVTTHANGELLHANRAALRWCDACAPLSLSDGRLRANQPDDQQKMMQALTQARLGRRSMMSFRQQAWVYSVGVVPITVRPDDASVVLFVLGALEKPTSLTLQFFCQAHRLTSAEGTVLDGLCRGLSPSQVAARGGVTVATVRSQITAIRSKTQTASLAHLLRMVAALPPLAQASALDR